jgi:hypothetical protein
LFKCFQQNDGSHPTLQNAIICSYSLVEVNDSWSERKSTFAPRQSSLSSRRDRVFFWELQLFRPTRIGPLAGSKPQIEASHPHVQVHNISRPCSRNPPPPQKWALEEPGCVNICSSPHSYFMSDAGRNTSKSPCNDARKIVRASKWALVFSTDAGTISPPSCVAGPGISET